MSTQIETNPTCESLADLLAGVALDAASGEERVQVQRHVVACHRCAADLDELREAAAALGELVPQVAPPPALRERVLAAAQRERPGGGSPVRKEPLPIARAVRRISPIWGAIAAAVIVSGGSLAWAASLQSQMAALTVQAQVAQAERDKAARYDRIVQVLASQQMESRPLTPAREGVRATGTIWLDPSSQSGMVMLHDLPPAPPGRGWQLWFVRGSQRVSGGMLRADETGSGYTLVQVPADLKSFDSIGITEEPASGSPAPTTPRIVGTQI